mmetsp:Transcript_9134/g.14613  ORF Transcript_9134/g.14613 Transcript_9134/m.14613 type:complete len:131 (-) Transcript_9134:127-519(-)
MSLRKATVVLLADTLGLASVDVGCPCTTTASESALVLDEASSGSSFKKISTSSSVATVRLLSRYEIDDTEASENDGEPTTPSKAAAAVLELGRRFLIKDLEDFFTRLSTWDMRVLVAERGVSATTEEPAT